MKANHAATRPPERRAGTGLAATCLLCAAGSPQLDWRNVCCRTRFLLALPSRAARQAWVSQWRQAGEAELVEQVLERLRQRAA